LFDSGALITAAKFQVQGMLVIDHILQYCRLGIPSEVKRETVVSGLLFDYQDAKEIELKFCMQYDLATQKVLLSFLCNA
jgi:hypothetical protein